MKKPNFIIKCIQFHHDENFKMIGNPIYREFAGSTLKEAKAAWKAARDNNDVVKFSPLTIYDIINSEEDTPDPADDNAMYYMDTEELTSIYADITEEQTTETTETTDTEEEEEEGTMFTNYTEAVTEDAAQYIRDNYTAEELAEKLADREEFAEELNDAMWVADEVTGNGSGSYTFNRMKAREFVLADIDTVQEALREFCTEADTIAEKFLGDDWEYFDVTARCYVLGQAIDAALDIIEAETKAA